AATASKTAVNRGRSRGVPPAWPPCPASTAEPTFTTGLRLLSRRDRALSVIRCASAHPYDSKAPRPLQKRLGAESAIGDDQGGIPRPRARAHAKNSELTRRAGDRRYARRSARQYRGTEGQPG